ncbi:hypothetical protein DP49_5281 [Burkholderia pseudomallei]|nr:hypothetical protein DP49_5281 [Burkholderia pseudomallei]
MRDRAPSPSPDGNAPVMSLDAGRAGAASHTANDACRSFAPGRPRAEISPARASPRRNISPERAMRTRRTRTRKRAGTASPACRFSV